MSGPVKTTITPDRAIHHTDSSIAAYRPMSQRMSDQAREAAQHAENEAREYHDGRFIAVVFPLAEAVRMLADEIDRHDRSLRAAFDAIGP